MIKNKFILYIFIFLTTLGMANGDTDINDLKVDYEVNWKNKQLEITVASLIDTISKPLPSVKYSIETKTKQNLPYILLNGIELLTVDSRTKGKDYIMLHPSVITSIFDISPQLVKVYSIVSNDLKTLTIKYTLDLYPHIAELFIPHSRANKLSAIMDFIPSADFTGIVIYVDEKLPMYGKQSTGSFNPSLFPKIFDEKLNIVMDLLMVDPESIKQNGAVGYQTLSDTLDLERIGETPLELKARSIFGINNTDLLISTRDAVKILSRQNNLELIKQGKILIIYSDDNK